MHRPEFIVSLWTFFESSLFPLPDQLRSEDAYARALSTWCALLEDLTEDQIRAAASVWVSTAGNRFFPTPAQLREAAAAACPGRLDADSAWGLLTHALRMRGPSDPPQIGGTPPPVVSFEPVVQGGRRKLRRVLTPGPPGWRLSADPDTCAAMEAGLAAVGGWRALAESEEGHLAASFRRAFDAARASAAQQAVAVRLLGWQPAQLTADATAPTPSAAPTLAVLPGGRQG